MSERVTVLLHGFTGSPLVWDGMLASLPGRVVTPTLPGHGSRPAPVGAWQEEIDALGARLAAEGVRGAHLVGYSLGGRIARHLLDRDDLFTRATLIGAHPGLISASERDARRAADARWIERLEREGIEAFVSAWEALPLWRTQTSLPPHVVERQRAIRRSHTAAGLAAALRSLGLAEMPAPPAARVPARWVVGALDEPLRAVVTRASLPLTLVPAAGHNVVLEAPAALAELLA